MFVSIKAACSPFSPSLVLSLLAVLLLPSRGLAQNQADTATHFYVTAGAVLESSFEFAGQMNNLEEEGSGFYLGGGYSFNDKISLELGYTGANDYSNNAGQYSDVKNGANLLDRLIKDIVTESNCFDVERFVPLLQKYIRRSNPYIRQLLVGAIHS